MFMLNMCSLDLRTHLRYRRMMDAELGVLRVEIADYLHETLPQGTGGRLAVFDGAPGAPSPAAEEDEGWEAVELDPAMTEAILSQPDGQAVLAMVKKQTLKDRKSGKERARGNAKMEGPATSAALPTPSRRHVLNAPRESRLEGLSAWTSRMTR